MKGFYGKQEVEALKNADKKYFLHPFSSINDVLGRAIDEVGVKNLG